MFRIIPRQGMYHFNGYFRNLFNKKINVSDFERKFSEYLGVKNVIATGSATLALYLILKNIKNKNNDEIILAGYNYYDLVNVINNCGMKPVFVDYEQDTFGMNIDQIKEKITKNTRVILVTYLFGFAQNIEDILKLARKNNIVVIGDCTHAIGFEINNKKLGSFSDFSIFSFNKWKLVNCLGGGAICCNDDKIAEIIKNETGAYSLPKNAKVLRRIVFDYISWVLLFRKIFSIFVFPIVYFFGLFSKDILFDLTKDKLLNAFSEKNKIGFTKLQASIGIEMLNYLDKINDERRVKYHKLFELIKNKYIRTIGLKEKISPIMFPIVVKNKESAYNYLLKNGIDCIKKYYGYSLNKNNIEDNLLLLPIHHNITNRDIFYIADILNDLNLRD